jgi:hypothetical protein
MSEHVCEALEMKIIIHGRKELPGLAFHIALRLTLVVSVFTGKSEPRPSAQIAAQELVPPPAKEVPKEVITHGDRRVDDYFWLREKTDAEMIA